MKRVNLINLCGCDVRYYTSTDNFVNSNIEESVLIKKTRYSISLDFSHIEKSEPLRTSKTLEKKNIKRSVLKEVQYLEEVIKNNKPLLNLIEDPIGLLYFEDGEDLGYLSLEEFLSKCLGKELIPNDIKFLIPPKVYLYIKKYHKDKAELFYSPNVPKGLLKNDENSVWNVTKLMHWVDINNKNVNNLIHIYNE